MAINSLPIFQSLREIDYFIEQLADVVHELNEGEDSSFEEWLKSTWVTLPLSVGIIIVKVVYYFLTHKNIVAVHNDK